ncbi:MAG: hypothetical protein AAFY71_07045 [Bacteroidota bacterium]
MTKICHISILNPQRHSRLYYRWAKGNVEGGFEVVVVAQGKEEGLNKDGIKMVSSGSFHRLSLKRFLFSRSIRQQAKEIHAEIYVLHSPELLSLGKWLKHELGATIVYDVHEDFHKNLLYSPNYPGFLRKFLANYLRNMERKATAWLDGWVYAEDCYRDILGRDSQKTHYFRNKFVLPLEPESFEWPVQGPYALYTGTLAEEWGVMDSLEWWIQAFPILKIPLVLAGFDANGRLVPRINKRVQDSGLGAYFYLVGGETYVPYAHIIQLIRGCSFGMALYHPLPQIKGKIPTKFYEYLALGKPLLYTKEGSWDNVNQKYKLGIPWDEGSQYSKERLNSVLQQLMDWKEKEQEKVKFLSSGEWEALNNWLSELNH